MLELRVLRAEKDRIIEAFNKRNLPAEQIALVDHIIQLDDQRKETQLIVDQGLAQVNQLSKQIGALMASGQKSEAESLKEQVNQAKESIKSSEISLENIKQEIENQLLNLPNAPYKEVPYGKGSEDNEVYKSWDKPMPLLPQNALPHWELVKKYDLIDFELGTKITGSGFPLYRKQGARLQRALINFFLDEAVAAGFEEIQPPLLVNAESAKATGQLPDKEGQMYFATKDDLYLIPTAEVPITNIYRDVIIKESDFPIKMAGYTPCFRREAGSYGAHVKGLNRVHQFDKVEIVMIEHPEKSYHSLMYMLKHVEGLLEKLELPYRILRLCGGDMGFTSAMTFDFEVFSAAQEKWLEVSSVSNFETFQSNRMKLRYKSDKGENILAHTLNGSALALARIVASLLENNQKEDGIYIPKALQAYTGFEIIR